MCIDDLWNLHTHTHTHTTTYTSTHSESILIMHTCMYLIETNRHEYPMRNIQDVNLSYKMKFHFSVKLILNSWMVNINSENYFIHDIGQYTYFCGIV